MKPSPSAEGTIRKERRKYFPEQFGLNGFRELVHVRFIDACPPIGEHIHPDAIELCYITKGSQTYAAAGQRRRIGAGMAYLSYPNEPHSTDALQQEKDVELYYMIIDTVNDNGCFLGLSEEDGLRLTGLLNGLDRSFHIGMEFKKRLDEMLALLAEKPEGFELLLRCHACLMIHELARASRKPQPEFTQDILQAVQFIEDRLSDGPINISDAAAHVHLSVSRFKQKFRSQVGLPPVAYQQKRRIELSCDMLMDSSSITQTALALGFSSSQHFATTFRRYMGMSPREWKKALCQCDRIAKDL